VRVGSMGLEMKLRGGVLPPYNPNPETANNSKII